MSDPCVQPKSVRPFLCLLLVIEPIQRAIAIDYIVHSNAPGDAVHCAVHCTAQFAVQWAMYCAAQLQLPPILFCQLANASRARGNDPDGRSQWPTAMDSLAVGRRESRPDWRALLQSVRALIDVI